MSLFNPDPNQPAWWMLMPTDDDLQQATEVQRNLWMALNAKISRIHSAWANLELHLALLFSAVLRIKIAEAQVILGTLTANRPKRDLIMNCAKLSIMNMDKVKIIERLLRRTAKAASKRNFLAHGMAAYHQKYPDCVTVSGISADLEPALSHYIAFSEKDLKAIYDTISKISEDIYETLPIIWRARRRSLPQTPIQK